MALLLSPTDELLDLHVIYHGDECPLLTDWGLEHLIAARTVVVRRVWSPSAGIIIPGPTAMSQQHK